MSNAEEKGFDFSQLTPSLKKWLRVNSKADTIKCIEFEGLEPKSPFLDITIYYGGCDIVHVGCWFIYSKPKRQRIYASFTQTANYLIESCQATTCLVIQLQKI